MPVFCIASINVTKNCNSIDAEGVGVDVGSGWSSPVCLLAELPLPHIINGTEAELIGARRDQAIDRHRCGLRLDIGQQDGPGSI